MAIKYTTNLKLILEDNLTNIARANLEKIDSLGSVFTTTSTENLSIKSASTINLNPNSSDVGGSGSGGIINLGSATQELTAANIYALLSSFTGDVNIAGSLILQSGLNTLTLHTGTQTGDVDFTLPIADGTTGQLLTTDGLGQLGWANPAAAVIADYQTTWITADGLTKVVTHNLATTKIIMFIKEISTSDVIYVDNIDITDSNNVTLTASETPDASGWLVYIIGN